MVEIKFTKFLFKFSKISKVRVKIVHKLNGGDNTSPESTEASHRRLEEENRLSLFKNDRQRVIVHDLKTLLTLQDELILEVIRVEQALKDRIGNAEREIQTRSELFEQFSLALSPNEIPHGIEMLR